MTDFIYTNESSISSELCDDIIKMFEEQMEGKYRGIIGNNKTHDKQIKNTIDFVITKEPKWKKIWEFLEKELTNNVTEFLNNITLKEYNTEHRKFFFFRKLHSDTFVIQKYHKNEGKFSYHDDFTVNFNNKSARVLTFIWYLNDVVEGGETEFWGGKYIITPKKGKLVFFPANWNYPHCGKPPLSSDKYILTGWLYSDISN